MDIELKNILILNAKEYFRNALNTDAKREYNSSVTLFFKAISALVDVFLLINEGRIPSNHAERFRILELKYKEYAAFAQTPTTWEISMYTDA